jgi:hypothetical protein
MSVPLDRGELVFGDLEEGVTYTGIPDPSRLDLIVCTAPLFDCRVPKHVTDEVRTQMRNLDLSSPVQLHPLPDRARNLSLVIRENFEGM